jgi:hypothetical protein
MDRPMVFSYRNSKGTTYYLHGHVVTMPTGRRQSMYYFSKSPAEALAAVPEGYEVAEARTGLPVLKKRTQP